MTQTRSPAPAARLAASRRIGAALAFGALTLLAGRATAASTGDAQAASTDVQDVRAAHWVSLPTGSQIASLYPAEAAKTKTSGFAMVHCHVQDSGELTDCQTTVESPAGYGFAEATVGVAHYFKLAPGRYSPDASLDIPFRWRLQ